MKRSFLSLLLSLLSAVLLFSGCDTSVGLHKHNYQSTVVAPTATEQGYTRYHCSCGDSFIQDYEDALEGMSFAKIEKGLTKW